MEKWAIFQSLFTINKNSRWGLVIFRGTLANCQKVSLDKKSPFSVIHIHEKKIFFTVCFSNNEIEEIFLTSLACDKLSTNTFIFLHINSKFSPFLHSILNAWTFRPNWSSHKFYFKQNKILRAFLPQICNIFNISIKNFEYLVCLVQMDYKTDVFTHRDWLFSTLTNFKILRFFFTFESFFCNSTRFYDNVR